MVHDAEREHDCSDRPNRGENEQIGPIDPAMQDWKVFGQRIGKYNYKECQHADGKPGYLTTRGALNPGFAFSDQPARTEKRIAKAEADAAKHRKRRQPADRATGIFTIRELQSFDQSANRHSLNESCDQGSAGEAQIPNPAQPLGFIAKLERDSP